jgi:HK97 gp10 family phage protein
MNAETQRELTHLIKQLRKVSDTAKKQSQKAFKEAAGPLVSAIKARAPQSEKSHHRYNTSKLSKSIRAPKGMGNIVATYQPGNLGRSFKTLTFRRSAAVFVGAKLAKGNNKGTFAGARTDGYYAHWVEYGAPGQNVPASPFVRPAVDAAGDLVLRIATDILKREIESLNK